MKSASNSISPRRCSRAQKKAGKATNEATMVPGSHINTTIEVFKKAKNAKWQER